MAGSHKVQRLCDSGFRACLHPKHSTFQDPLRSEVGLQPEFVRRLVLGVTPGGDWPNASCPICIPTTSHSNAMLLMPIGFFINSDLERDPGHNAPRTELSADGYWMPA